MYNYGARNVYPQRQQGLPPGWEGKWDPQSRRWFYINHNDRTTHWELPKTPRPQPPAAASFAVNEMYVKNLQEQFPSAPQNIIRQVLTTKQNNFVEAKALLESMGFKKKIQVVADAKLAKQLVSDYMNLSTTVAQNLLVEKNNNLDSVVRVLSQQGYQKRSAMTKASAFHIQTLKKEYPGVNDDLLEELLVKHKNAIKTVRSSLDSMGFTKASAPKKNKSPTKPKVTKPAGPSEAEKKSRIKELQKKFPSVTERIIEMSLAGTQYNVKIAETILQKSLNDLEASKSSPTATSGTTSTQEDTPSFQSSSLEPVIFGEDDDKENDYKPELPSFSSKIIPKKSTYIKPVIERVKRPRAAPVKNVPRKKPATTGYISANRCVPTGANPELVQGPNPSLLQESLIQATGPDPGNRSGPQLSNRCGPDPSNAMGPAGLATGVLLETYI